MANKDGGKEPLLTRIGQWGTRKVRRPELFDRSAQNMQGASRSAIEAVTPAPLDSKEFAAGYRGRHADGGRARFHEMAEANGLSHQDLDRVGDRHAFFAAAYCLAALAALAYAFYMLFTGDGLFAIATCTGLSTVFFSFMAVAMRYDYSAWQVRARRFGGFSEYLETRL